MNTKAHFAAEALAPLMVVPIEQASADTRSIVAGVIAGSHVTARINHHPRRRCTTATATRQTAPSCGIFCQQNKDMQATLNHFAHDAGPVDGELGGIRAIRESKGSDGDKRRFMRLL